MGPQSRDLLSLVSELNSSPAPPNTHNSCPHGGLGLGLAVLGFWVLEAQQKQQRPSLPQEHRSLLTRDESSETLGSESLTSNARETKPDRSGKRPGHLGQRGSVVELDL